MALLDLNPAQLTAATTVGRPVLVLAGAGSGKTRVVAARIAHLIANEGVRSTQILGVTFTNKAAREMRERVIQVVGKSKGKNVTLSTFHSLGCAILREDIHHLGIPPDFSIYATGEQLSLITSIVRDLYGQRMNLHPGIMLYRISLAKNRLESPDEVTPRFNDKYDEILPAVYARYDRSLRACNAVDFDDLLLLVLRLFQQHEDVAQKYRTKYKHIIVDEFQDTNPLQMKMIDAMAGEGKGLCVVGDDDQSIYAWRGADIQNILSFAERRRTCLRVTLDLNYRSTNIILAAANAVVANNPGRHEKTLRSQLGEGVCIDVVKCLHEADEAAAVIERLLYFRQRFRLNWRDFAILYRANGQAKPFERLLVQKRLPYRAIGGTEYFDRKEVRDTLAYLQAIVNASDNLNLLRILNYPRRGIGGVSIERIMNWAAEKRVSVEQTLRNAGDIPGVNSDAVQGIGGFLQLLDEFRGKLKRKAAGKDSVSTLVAELVEAAGIKDELRAAKEPRERIEARLRNIDNLVEAANVYEAEARSKASLRDFLAQVALVSDRDLGGEPDENPDRITLMTLHGAKGLEFPFVFLAGVEDGLLPHSRALREAGGVHEERRLFYVGMTRARRHLTITHAEERATERGAKRLPLSRFVGEIPDRLLNVTHSSDGPAFCYANPETAAQRADFGLLLKNLAEKRKNKQLPALTV